MPNENECDSEDEEPKSTLIERRPNLLKDCNSDMLDSNFSDWEPVERTK